MREIIVLKKVYKGKKYLGMHIAYIDDLTPEYLARLKADVSDKEGWKQYRKVMKDAGYNIGKVEPIE